VSELTRRQLIGSVGSAAAVTVLTPHAFAAGASKSAGNRFAAVTSRAGAVSAQAGPAYSGYQVEIYLNGVRGVTPKITTNLSRLEAEAAGVISPRAQKYLLADAGGRGTVRANARAFDKWRIIPLMFRDHAVRDLSTTVLGAHMPAPVLLAPVGRQKLAHPDGELASARAAAGLGLTYIHSAKASYSLEDVAAANDAGSRWYELKWPKRGRLDISLLERARAALYTHLVITLPSSDPNWKQLRSIRENWDAPILLKGVRTVEDARRAVKHGIEGIIVSNHGGRASDKSSGSLDALPAIARRTARRLSVLFDSGVRTAPDVFKALALGADAVLFGRPYVFGLALDGEAGVTHVMRTLLAEVDLSLGNAGYTTHLDLSAASLSAIR
jgi:isopentenyl diphosphate isomerase/L-lactate dehydrogenase-like FMN-dependent dehydrogenase